MPGLPHYADRLSAVTTVSEDEHIALQIDAKADDVIKFIDSLQDNP